MRQNSPLDDFLDEGGREGLLGLVVGRHLFEHLWFPTPASGSAQTRNNLHQIRYRLTNFLASGQDTINTHVPYYMSEGNKFEYLGRSLNPPSAN
jgi:hypothetical protein